jgi:hypothetical protein
MHGLGPARQNSHAHDQVVGADRSAQLLQGGCCTVIEALCSAGSGRQDGRSLVDCGAAGEIEPRRHPAPAELLARYDVNPAIPVTCRACHRRPAFLSVGQGLGRRARVQAGE